MSPRASRPSFWEQYRSFGIVVDAGSSGSRLQVYSWLKHPVAKSFIEQQNDSLSQMPKVEPGTENPDEWHIKAEPGISSFASHPEDVASYLKPLFDHALSVIPPSAQSSTPVHLLATAGMRLLNESDRKNILDSACSFIQQNYPFHLPDCSQHVRVISGQEEGLFGWIAVNYLMDGFDRHDYDHDEALLINANGDETKTTSTYGFLDMGGASTQIAFEPTAKEQLAHADNLVRVRLRLLDGRDVYHQVFVTTWLGFGTLKTRDRYVDQQISRYLEENANNYNNKESKYLGTEHRITMIEDPCLPRDLTLTEERHKNFALTGKGDFKTCMEKTLPLLNKESECFDEPCLFDGVHVPPIDFDVNRFIGVSDYWYSLQDIWKLGGVYDYQKFDRKAHEYCSRPWHEILAEFKMDTGRLEMQCFKAAWIANILHEGIGIPKHHSLSHSSQQEEQQQQQLIGTTKTPYFQSKQDVNNMAISWTLGKMVLEVSQSIEATGESGGIDNDKQTDNDSSSSSSSSKWKWYQDVQAHSFGSGTRHVVGKTVRGLPMLTWMGTAMFAVFVLGLLFWMFWFSGRRRRAKRWGKRSNRTRSSNEEEQIDGLINGNKHHQNQLNHHHNEQKRKYRLHKLFWLRPHRLLSLVGRLIPARLRTPSSTLPSSSVASSVNSSTNSPSMTAVNSNIPSPRPDSPSQYSPERPQSLNRANSTPAVVMVSSLGALSSYDSPPPPYAQSLGINGHNQADPNNAAQPATPPLRPRSRAGHINQLNINNNNNNNNNTNTNNNIIGSNGSLPLQSSSSLSSTSVPSFLPANSLVTATTTCTSEPSFLGLSASVVSSPPSSISSSSMLGIPSVSSAQPSSNSSSPATTVVMASSEAGDVSLSRTSSTANLSMSTRRNQKLDDDEDAY